MEMLGEGRKGLVVMVFVSALQVYCTKSTAGAPQLKWLFRILL